MRKALQINSVVLKELCPRPTLITSGNQNKKEHEEHLDTPIWQYVAQKKSGNGELESVNVILKNQC